MSLPFACTARTSLARALSRLVAAASIALSGMAAAGPASDSWSNPNESGWGLTVVQEGASFGFAMYVFDSNSNPTWYQGGGTGTATGTTWSGNVFSHRGPYFGGPFTAGSTPTQVGTFTFTQTATNSATFSYTINGTAVTKTVQRLAAGNANLTGNTAGSFIARYSGCANNMADFNDEEFASFDFTQTGTAVSIRVIFQAGATCTYTGTYSQEGRYGRVQGTYTCDNAAAGNFTLYEIESNSRGFMARMTGNVTQNTLACSLNARLAGVIRAVAGF